MTMRKKDYEAIARAIDSLVPPLPHTDMLVLRQAGTLREISKRIADYCATQDPTFKRDRFLADCGVSHD